MINALMRTAQQKMNFKNIKGVRLFSFIFIFVIAGLQALQSAAPSDYIAAAIAILGVIKSFFPSDNN